MLLRDPVLVQVPTPTIANEINVATRVVHTELNKLIIARLPLALPPHQTTSTPYTIGLEAFAAIFFAFEAAWDQCLAQHHPSTASSLELFSALNCLLPSNLRRTQHLRNDLRHLRSRAVIPNVAGDAQAKMHLYAMSAAANKPGSILHSYISHINQMISEKPHVIIAYTWVMYMALFSGGRWIRAQLRTGGDEFWMRGAEVAGDLGYSFLTFDGEHDGDDIKTEFKRQLASVDSILTPAQRVDVVTEAQDVFQRTVELIGQLDELASNVAATTIEKRALDSSLIDASRLPAVSHEIHEALHTVPLLAGKVSYRRAPMLLLPAILCILVLCLTSLKNPLTSHVHHETT